MEQFALERRDLDHVEINVRCLHNNHETETAARNHKPFRVVRSATDDRDCTHVTHHPEEPCDKSKTHKFDL